MKNNPKLLYLVSFDLDSTDLAVKIMDQSENEYGIPIDESFEEESKYTDKHKLWTEKVSVHVIVTLPDYLDLSSEVPYALGIIKGNYSGKKDAMSDPRFPGLIKELEQELYGYLEEYESELGSLDEYIGTETFHCMNVLVTIDRAKAIKDQQPDKYEEIKQKFIDQYYEYLPGKFVYKEDF